MNIAIASGKGGTGKTTISTNLARLLLSHNRKVQYLDCDVEEPNGHLFLRPRIETMTMVEVPVPNIDENKCIHCGKCSNLCRFHALANLGKTILTFPELCHGCGGCARVCPAGAITEVGRSIGKLETGNGMGIEFVHGVLNVGETMSPPLINAVTECAEPDYVSILDAPPGTSCQLVATLERADIVVVVTEPTPFGLHDLELAVDVVEQMSIPYGVIINRCDMGDDRVEEFCRARGVPVWGRIPHRRDIAEMCSRGELMVEHIPEAAEWLTPLVNIVREGRICAR